MNILASNSDNAIQFTLLDSDGTPIDPESADVSNIEIAIYQRKDIVLQRFSMTGNSVIVDDAAEGTVHVNLDKANLNGIKTRRIYGELILSLVNVNFANNIQRIVITDIEIADVKQSVLNVS